MPAAAPAVPLQLQETDEIVVVGGEGFEVRISKQTGALISYEVDAQPLLAAPLEPNFWKAPNDNQYRNDYLNRMGPWRNAARDRTVQHVTTKAFDDGLTQVMCQATLPVGQSTYRTVYTVRSDARVTVTAEYQPGTVRSSSAAEVRHDDQCCRRS